MILYKKENGYPINLKIETYEHEEIMEDNEVWKGFKSIAIDEEEQVIATFIHGTYRDRIRWVEGFMEGIKYREPWLVDKWYQEDWKEPSLPLIEDDGKSNLEVGDWVVTTDDKVRRIDMDSQEDLPFELIKRFATRAEAKNAKEINELVQDLKREKASNKASWDMYGSELCAGDMINKERALENKIAELRIDENM